MKVQKNSLERFNLFMLYTESEDYFDEMGGEEMKLLYKSFIEWANPKQPVNSKIKYGLNIYETKEDDKDKFASRHYFFGML